MTRIDKVANNEIIVILKQFIRENFLPSSGLDEFGNKDSFMEKGIIDSTGVLELLGFIEDRFNIRVEDDEIIPDNLDSLDTLTSYIKRKIGHARS